MTQRTKETKNYMYQLRTKLTKHKLENKTKARCQVVNKAMKNTLTIVLLLMTSPDYLMCETQKK